MAASGQINIQATVAGAGQAAAQLGLLEGGLARIAVQKSGLLSVAAALGAIGMAIKEGIGSNAQFEQFEMTFEVLFRSAEAAKVKMEELSKFARETPFELPGVVDAAVTLEAANLSSRRFLKTVGDLTAANKSMGTTMTDVAIALQRIKAEDFGVAFSRLKDFKISRQDLKDQGLKFDGVGHYLGGVEEALVAVEKIVAEKFPDMMKRQSQTFFGIWSNVVDTVGIMLRDLTTPLFDRAKEGLSGFLALLDRAAPTVKAWGEQLGKLFDKFSSSIDWNFLNEALGDLTGSFETLYGTFLMLIPTFELIASGFGKAFAPVMGDSLIQASTVITGFANALLILSTTVQVFGVISFQVFQKWSNNLATHLKIGEKAVEAFKAMAQNPFDSKHKESVNNWFSSWQKYLKDENERQNSFVDQGANAQIQEIFDKMENSQIDLGKVMSAKELLEQKRIMDELEADRYKASKDTEKADPKASQKLSMMDQIIDKTRKMAMTELEYENWKAGQQVSIWRRVLGNRQEINDWYNLQIRENREKHEDRMAEYTAKITGDEMATVIRRVEKEKKVFEKLGFDKVQIEKWAQQEITNAKLSRGVREDLDSTSRMSDNTIEQRKKQIEQARKDLASYTGAGGNDPNNLKYLQDAVAKYEVGLRDAYVKSAEEGLDSVIDIFQGKFDAIGNSLTNTLKKSLAESLSETGAFKTLHDNLDKVVSSVVDKIQLSVEGKEGGFSGAAMLWGGVVAAAAVGISLLADASVKAAKAMVEASKELQEMVGAPKSDLGSTIYGINNQFKEVADKYGFRESGDGYSEKPGKFLGIIPMGGSAELVEKMTPDKLKKIRDHEIAKAVGVWKQGQMGAIWDNWDKVSIERGGQNEFGAAVNSIRIDTSFGISKVMDDVNNNVFDSDPQKNLEIGNEMIRVIKDSADSQIALLQAQLETQSKILARDNAHEIRDLDRKIAVINGSMTEAEATRQTSIDNAYKKMQETIEANNRSGMPNVSERDAEAKAIYEKEVKLANLIAANAAKGTYSNPMVVKDISLEKLFAQPDAFFFMRYSGGGGSTQPTTNVNLYVNGDAVTPGNVGNYVKQALRSGDVAKTAARAVNNVNKMNGRSLSR